MNKESTKKSVAVLGGGIAGIYAAYRLAQAGYQVVIFEKENQLGGLAATFKIGSGYLEKFYHHLFQTDQIILKLIKELGLGDKFYFAKLKTAIYYQGRTYLLNGALDLLKFKPLSFFARLRTGAILFFLKKNKRWQSLAKIEADRWLAKWLGQKSHSILWQPLLKAKFGSFWQKVSMSWFWSRIHCRSAKLGYFQGGFKVLFDKLTSEVEKFGVEVNLKTDVKLVRYDHKKNEVFIKTANQSENFDFVISTLPESILPKVFQDLSTDFAEKFTCHSHLGAQTLILLLDRRLLDYYWLNINDSSFPFLVVVDQSYIASVANHNNLYPVYFGNYLNYDDPRWQLNQDDLLNLYLPFIKKLNPNFSPDWIKSKFIFKMPAAQYVVSTDYQKTILPIKLPVKNCYSAAMSQVYPQDRGTNYALVLVDRVIKELKAIDK